LLADFRQGSAGRPDWIQEIKHDGYRILARSRRQRADCFGRRARVAAGLDDGKFVDIRIPNPLGFFGKNIDGRIDEPDAGWKGARSVDHDWHTRLFPQRGREGCVAQVVQGADPVGSIAELMIYTHLVEWRFELAGMPVNHIPVHNAVVHHDRQNVDEAGLGNVFFAAKKPDLPLLSNRDGARMRPETIGGAAERTPRWKP
jgi:hypothetical protein